MFRRIALIASHKGFKVKHHQPWKAWVGVVFIIALLVVCFLLGREYQLHESHRLQREREILVQQIVDLETRNNNLVQKNAQLARISQVERDAYQLANRTLIKHQEEMLNLKEELAFYQGIVSPTSAALAINLQSFEIERKNDQNLYHFKLVLTKSGRRNRNIKGRFDLILRGVTAGNIREYRLEEIKLNQEDKFDTFNFLYFQVFEGDFIMPEDFAPYEIEIYVNPSTKEVKSLTETILWTTVMSGDL